MSPEPDDLVSIFFGLPRYSMSPEPDTLATKDWLAVTLMSADPETVAFTNSASSSKAFTSPEPDTEMFKSVVFPERLMSPEPEREASTCSDSTVRLISPEPAIRVLKLSLRMVVLPTMSPDPDKLTSLMDSMGTVRDKAAR